MKMTLTDMPKWKSAHERLMKAFSLFTSLVVAGILVLFVITVLLFVGALVVFVISPWIPWPSSFAGWWHWLNIHVWNSWELLCYVSAGWLAARVVVSKYIPIQHDWVNLQTLNKFVELIIAAAPFVLMAQLILCFGLIPWVRERHEFHEELPRLQDRVDRFLEPQSTAKLGTPIEVSNERRRFILVDVDSRVVQLRKSLQATVEDLDAGIVYIATTKNRQIYAGEWYLNGRRKGPAIDNYVEVTVRDYATRMEVTSGSLEYWGSDGYSVAEGWLSDNFQPESLGIKWRSSILPSLFPIALSLVAISFCNCFDGGQHDRSV